MSKIGLQIFDEEGNLIEEMLYVDQWGTRSLKLSLEAG